MEKTVVIDNKEVKFKTNGAAPLKYKFQFKRDFFSDIVKMQSAMDGDLSALDLETFYNILWIFAKTADPSIPEPIKWLETFDSFPLAEIIPETIDLITSCLTSSNPQKN